MIGNNRSIDLSRWGYSFLVTDMLLTQEEREELIMDATVMYLNGLKKIDIEGESYEGRIETSGDYQMLGAFGGQKFSAVLETNHGKAKLEFLVTEHINHNLN